MVVDIDHSPRHLLADGSAGFYGVEGTWRLAAHLRPGGVYSLWSNDRPTTPTVDVAAEVVTFPNPLQERTATNTVYLAAKPS